MKLWSFKKKLNRIGIEKKINDRRIDTPDELKNLKILKKINKKRKMPKRSIIINPQILNILKNIECNIIEPKGKAIIFKFSLNEFKEILNSPCDRYFING